MIYIGSDHAGFGLKEKIKKFLIKRKYAFEDAGPEKYNKDDDYPDFIVPVAKKVAKDKKSLGIVFGGSGQGEALVANKIKGIRAALYYGGNLNIIRLSKKHNNANILSLGAKFLTEKQAIRAVDLWLKTSFSKEKRHKRRLKKINEIEKKK